MQNQKGITELFCAGVDLLEQFVVVNLVAGFFRRGQLDPDGSARLAGGRVFEAGVRFGAGLKEFFDVLKQDDVADTELVKIRDALRSGQF